MKDFIVGIDIGTSSTRIVVCKEKEGSRKPQIVATATVPSRGLRHGYITQPAEVTQSVKDALAQVQKDIKQPIRHAYVGLGGISLGSYVHSTSLAISGGNSQVTQADIDRILEKGTEEITRDRKNIIVVHAFPIHYRIDNEEVLGTPLGMHGTQLHVKIIFITTLDLHYETLVRSVEKADIEVIDVIAAPLALSAVVMPHRHKTVGSLLLNIGAETTSLAVFEDGYLIDVSVVRFGSHDITNDLALGFKIDLEEAERVKKKSRS
ncbi:MAG: cell division protein FtsA [Candidatus Pacebacteria bacterium]|nr:cell division protein FtsA [Candidatus Paceibacterota bacterium]